MNTLMDTAKFFIFIFLELTALFLAVSTLVGVLFRSVPSDRFKDFLSRKGLLGNLFGAGLGAITPFCSCSTIPLTVGLLRAGAPFGATMSFVLASPLLNPIILTMFSALLGWKATLVYGTTTFLAAVFSGSVLQFFGFEQDVKKVRVHGGKKFAEGPSPFLIKFRDAFCDAWLDYRGILLFLVLGVSVGSAIYGYLPVEFASKLAGPGNPLAIPIAALIGIPLYVRAETVIPVALALTGKGMSLGAVLALIIGGAGMSLPEMSMLAGIFRKRLVTVFVGVVFVTATAAGFLINAV